MNLAVLWIKYLWVAEVLQYFKVKQIHKNLALENFGYTVVVAWCHVKIRVTRVGNYFVVH